jgi:hypothetical protein
MSTNLAFDQFTRCVFIDTGTLKEHVGADTITTPQLGLG